MRMSIYSCTFQSIIFESVILESIKIKIFCKSVKMIQIIISENDTFESVILESVKFESVRVDGHPQCHQGIGNLDSGYLIA